MVKKISFKGFDSIIGHCTVYSSNAMHTSSSNFPGVDNLANKVAAQDERKLVALSRLTQKILKNFKNIGKIFFSLYVYCRHFLYIYIYIIPGKSLRGSIFSIKGVL